jgi:excisionase family DNA binding protein
MHPHEHAKRKAAAGSTEPRAFGLVKAAYSVNETLELLSIGRTSLYEAVKRGDLKLVKFGTKTLVFATDLAAFLAQLKGAR